jgi:tetratricopeptide (TPR) repeat protein
METGKRVLPLLKDGDAESTLQLAGLPRVDFTKAWDAGWRELQQALAGIASPEARREELEGQRHIFARKLLNAKGASRDRYQRKVAEVDARLQAEQQREREPVRVDHAVSIVRVVNEPPLLPDQFPPLLPDQFVGRRLEIQRLEDHLRDPSIGLVAVVGPAGIGKTSMIVRLIYGLRKDPRWLPVDALVYLTANGSRPIGPATILEDLCRVLPDQATAARLGARLNDAAFAPSDTLDEFLEALRDTRVVVVIDNAEELLDTGGRLRDPELDELLRVLLSQRDHRVKLVLVTHAPPISILRGFPVSAAQVDLASGLPPADAGRFLRSLDSAGTLGLDSLSGEQLDQVYRLTDGNPRALEMVSSVLESDPEASLPELLEEMDRSSTDKDVLSHLISRVFDRLDLADRRVLQALAVYGRPVPPAAVDYLLRWYLNGHQSEPTLRRLAEMRLVRREGGSFYLPRSPDRDQLLGGIPRGNAGDLGLAPPPLTRVALLHLAAEYFVVARKRRVERIDDLSAQLNEIDLRIQGQDYGTALRLISAVDDEYLSRWHYSAAVAHWRQQLIGKLPDPALELRNLYGIASARQQQDDLQGAIGLLLDALTLAKQLDDPPNLVRIQITLGGAYFEHGQISKAAELYQLALNAARAQRLQLEEARARGGLLVCLGETGRFVGALEQHAAALTVIQELQDSNSLTLKAELLVQSGWIYGQLGQTEEALASLRRGRELSRLLGDQVLEGRCLADEADVLIHDGRLAHAIELAGEATTIAASARSPRLSRQGNSTLALAYLAAGDLDAAREAADTAARHRRSRRALRALAMQGITALRQGEREKAQLAFLDASVRAETLRDREHRSFAVLDLHGAVLCGLVRCGDRDQLDRAISAYRTARAVTRAPGAVRRSLRLLDELGWDGEGSLAAARHAASGR